MFEDANRAIWDAYERAASRRVGRDRFPTLIHAIDELLFELEELNLAGADRVPVELRRHASELLGSVPAPVGEELRVRHRVVHLMDALFRAQELVFRAQDPARTAVDDEDEERSA